MEAFSQLARKIKETYRSLSSRHSTANIGSGVGPPERRCVFPNDIAGSYNSRKGLQERSDDHLSTSQAYIDKPFLISELHAAFARANSRSAKGLDNVTVSELGNLPESFLRLLLEEINIVWMTGSFPNA